MGRKKCTISELVDRVSFATPDSHISPGAVVAIMVVAACVDGVILRGILRMLRRHGVSHPCSILAVSYLSLIIVAGGIAGGRVKS